MYFEHIFRMKKGSMDNLKTIQTIMKVMKILTKVAFVACIVGGSLCLFGLLMLFLANGLGLMDEAVAVGMITKKDTSITVAYCAVLVGICQTLFGALIANRWNRYYTMEEADGTPFSEESGKFLFSTAIYELIMGFVAFIISTVIVAVFEATNSNMNFSHEVKLSFDAATVLFTMFLSILFRYGAAVKKD